MSSDAQRFNSWPQRSLPRGIAALAGAVEIDAGPATAFVAPNRVALELRMVRSRDYGGAGEGLAIPVHAPFAGRDGGITPPAQVRDAATRFGTPGERIQQRTVGDTWPEIAARIRREDDAAEPSPTAPEGARR